METKVVWSEKSSANLEHIYNYIAYVLALGEEAVLIVNYFSETQFSFLE